MEPLNVGEIDWEANWRRIVERRREIVEALVGQGPRHDYWTRRAPRFARMSREFDPSTDPLARMLHDALPAGGSFLDVGAGAGRYTIALADRARCVTAVEPSEAMRGHLEAEAAACGLTNVAVVPTTWEDASVEPHDVVLAAHVLYPIADVVPFIRKLHAAAARVCFVKLRVDQNLPQLAALWREVWGAERPREPGFLDLYNLLFAIGIRAHARLVPFGTGLRFDTLDEAVEHLRRLLFLPDDSREHDRRIRALLETALVREGDRLVLPHAVQAAIVWWENEGSAMA